MTTIREIVIGPSQDRPALVLRQTADVAEFEGGDEPEDSAAVAHALAALQGLPDLLLAGYVGATKLMEVQINGDLVSAASGEGYRAFAIGAGGITEQATLFDPTYLTGLIDAAAVWRLASIVVAQKHLADIHATLLRIEQGVSRIAQFQRDEQASKIESALDYLRQVEQALAHGETTPPVRHRLETIEADMDGIQRHLHKLFEARLDTRIKDANLIDHSSLAEGFLAKLGDLRELLHDHRLAGLSRVVALQALSMFPGEEGLKGARARSIQLAAAQNQSMCAALERVFPFEVVCCWTGRAEAALTNVGEFLLGQSKLHRWVNSKVLPKSLKFDGRTASSLRSPTGSDTPRLDTLKIAAVSMIHLTARAELQSAYGLVAASVATLGTATKIAQPRRFLVEWSASGPARIRQVGVKASSPAPIG